MYCFQNRLKVTHLQIYITTLLYLPLISQHCKLFSQTVTIPFNVKEALV